MKLVAMLRIKDQIDTIDECLGRLGELVDEIVICDNGSTDGTLEAYKKYPKVVEVLQTVGFDEGRDKCMAHEAAKKRSPDWMVWIDADEIFEPHFSRAILDGYMHSCHNRVTFRMCNFWLDKVYCRYDGPYLLYTFHPQRSMWRNIPEAYFKNVKIHNGDIQGLPGKPYISPYRLKHYGHVNPKKIKEKSALYTKVDPNSTRNYSDLNPEKSVKRFKYHEYESKFINYAYIIGYKYVCNMFWLALRVKGKVAKLSKRS